MSTQCVALTVARAISQADMILTVAGSGHAGYSGDGDLATSAELNEPLGLAVASNNDLYIADWTNFRTSNRVRRVRAGVITTVAGNGTSGFSGDGGPATAAQIGRPADVAVDTAGNLYIADVDKGRIREVRDGIITTVAGGGACCAPPANGTAATSAYLAFPGHVAIGTTGDLFISDAGANRLYEVRDGMITTVAGTGAAGFSGDGGPSVTADLNEPADLAVDTAGDVFFVDSANVRVREVSQGTIRTVAGNGLTGFAGDEGSATAAELSSPAGLAVDSSGDLYIADSGNERIRQVKGAVITTVAGTGAAGFAGDGGPAGQARFRVPRGLALDSQGDLFVSDSFNARVREIFNATPPGPPTLKVGRLTLGRALAGSRFTASMVVVNAIDGHPVRGTLSCSAALSNKVVPVSARREDSHGRATCSWDLPKSAAKKRLKGSVTVRYHGAQASRRFSLTVR